MADTKISALSAASLPLAGTEVLPIVQSGSTVKVATDNLTVKNIRSNATTGLLQVTGPAAASTRVVTVPDANFTAARTDAAQSFTGNQTLSTGNLVIGTAGKGIDFSADPSPAGMTSELLDDYEEGTWTPTLVANITLGDLAYTIQQGYYVKVGNVVTVWANITFTQTTASSYFYVTGLPFTSANLNNLVSSGALVLEGAWSGTITSPVVIQGKNTADAYFYKDFGNVIGTASSNSGAACTYFFAMTYRTA
jgi:hypothetical protein